MSLYFNEGTLRFDRSLFTTINQEAKCLVTFPRESKTRTTLYIPAFVKRKKNFLGLTKEFYIFAVFNSPAFLAKFCNLIDLPKNISTRGSTFIRFDDKELDRPESYVPLQLKNSKLLSEYTATVGYLLFTNALFTNVVLDTITDYHYNPEDEPCKVKHIIGNFFITKRNFPSALTDMIRDYHECIDPEFKCNLRGIG